MVLREAARRSGFKRKRAKFAGSGRGIGLSLFYHGAGFTGSGEVMLGSRAGLETTPGGVRILVANTEIGQGTRTMLAQIVADALEIPSEQVDVAPPDTSVVPDSGPTVASRTCMVVGGLLERCARRMRERLEARAGWHYAGTGGSVEEQYLAPGRGGATDVPGRRLCHVRWLRRGRGRAGRGHARGRVTRFVA
jgi:CO/xanthine dehydrogenase Mo-binding subunit